MSTEEGPAPGTYYAFKGSLVGVASEFLLHPHHLEWRRAHRSIDYPYREIRTVRLGYRPVTMQSYRFVTEIWATGRPKISFASTSWRGLVEQERHDVAYAAFVRVLHRRIANACANVRFRAGSPTVLYWPGVAILIGLFFGVAALAVHAAQTQAWTGFALVGAMLVFFLWQTSVFFRRNLPGSYTPDALPPRVLP